MKSSFYPRKWGKKKLKVVVCLKRKEHLLAEERGK